MIEENIVKHKLTAFRESPLCTGSQKTSSFQAGEKDTQRHENKQIEHLKHYLLDESNTGTFMYQLLDLT